ncbi:2,3-diaminopropionate biosynthesis protein SbnA [Streptosporangium carneum]|uniref:N-(2-amino-2-carboxyethyl)-L-glutamate synthase n=1 Tax=Streptosporangium carneum TaxID=47481 RepID=A0A9W6MGG0_9ACTN|nr:2,3-diaminopropionate biosynthesis protein SbnA [Streptosporangium carneum]GLK13196.1 2,3-diaminopropionate biosynthesis protein SbnA [Streptosporangium carneum]
MPVVTGAHELVDTNTYVDLRGVLGVNLHVKCEGFNFGGSVKLRSAAWMVAEAEQAGRIRSDTVLVESSSGNLGVALAVVAAAKGIRFVCVTDPKCNAAALRSMRALGADVMVVDEADEQGSFLSARKARVRYLCATHPGHLWLNQYENVAGWKSHYHITATAIAEEFAALDALFIGVGTGSTLTGCARYFRDYRPEVRIIGVDVVGSVNFGGVAGSRHIPGLGASESMPLVDSRIVDEVMRVPESDCVGMCRRLATQGLLLGGSSGTVISAAHRWLEAHDPRRLMTAVAIAPDLGDRYLDTIYDDAWVADHYDGAVTDLWRRELTR